MSIYFVCNGYQKAGGLVVVQGSWFFLSGFNSSLRRRSIH
uniref:Uncharacterized protein n=1 Tax=Arabidopsis thaliana TaxID=3702 RepID=Q0WR93_ARATH|nr:hypothetical protein [Arabidopsis thaliana]